MLLQPAGEGNHLRHRLAVELRRLRKESLADLPAWTAAAQALKNRLGSEYLALTDTDDSLHEIYHYLEDADTRARDPEYRVYQDQRIDAVVQHLEEDRPTSPA